MPTSLGPAEILVILVVALIVLGPKRLPEAGRQVGRALAEMRKWSQGFKDEIRTAIEPDVTPSPPPSPPPVSSPPSPAWEPPRPSGPSTPAETEYTGPIPEPATSGDADASGHTAPVGSNGSAPGSAAHDPSEPPAGEPPRS